MCIDKRKRPAASPPALAPAGAGTAALSGGTGPDPAGEVTGAAAVQTLRATGRAGAGGCVAVVGTLAAGSFAAVPAGVALAYLAWSDLAIRRFSLRLLGGATLTVCGVIGAEAIGGGATRRLLDWLLTLSALTVIAALVWSATKGVSFGDVLLVGFAALVPAWMSPAAVALMVGSAFVAAGAMVVARRLRSGTAVRDDAVAFGPALVVGWLVGVSFG